MEWEPYFQCQERFFFYNTAHKHEIFLPIAANDTIMVFICVNKHDLSLSGVYLTGLFPVYI